MGKVKKQLDNIDLDKLVLRRQLAIIGSMTLFERRNPKVLNASRKKRIAKGSGTEVQEINRLLKMHLQMADMMKKMGKQRGGLLGSLFGGGQPAVDMAELERLQGELKTLDPTALPPELRNLPLEGGLPKWSARARGTRRAVARTRWRGCRSRRAAGDQDFPVSRSRRNSVNLTKERRA